MVCKNSARLILTLIIRLAAPEKDFEPVWISTFPKWARFTIGASVGVVILALIVT